MIRMSADSYSDRGRVIGPEDPGDEEWMIRPWNGRPDRRQRSVELSSAEMRRSERQEKRETVDRAQWTPMEQQWDGSWRKAHPERTRLPVTRAEAADILGEIQAESEERTEHERQRRRFLRSLGW
jgi:hypothetical protein